MRVFLFDIDGTLIHSGGAGLAALRLAFTEVFGVADPQDVPVSGRTDRGIAWELFEVHGVPAHEENWTRFRDAYLRHLQAQLPQRDGAVLPGVLDLIERLAQQERVAIGLLTGNVRAGARAKLEYYRLFQHFQFGGFGDLHSERNDVAQEALAASRQHCNGHAVSTDRVWVIGDTPLDVRCARHIGAKVIAVATGGFTREELLASEPDLAVNDLTELLECGDLSPL